MATIILFAPLVGALICGFGWRWIGERAAMATATGHLFLACLLSWIVFLTFHGETESIPLFRWIDSGTLSADWAIRLDRMTAIMLVVVTTVSALVHLYSFGYMDHDVNFKEGESYNPRFFAYLSFFTFAMLSLGTADNLRKLFFGWECVGVSSYLLIGFYYRKSSAGAAALTAATLPWLGRSAFAQADFNWRQFEGEHIEALLTKNPRSDLLQQYEPEFTELTGIDVGSEQVPEQQQRQKQVIEFTSGGTSFDVTNVSWHVQKRLFGKGKWLEDLRPYLADPALTPATYDFDDFSNAGVTYATQADGRIDTLPYFIDYWIVYWNKELFDAKGIAYPTNYEELLEAAKALHDPANGVYGWVSR
jgi:hypothetical protein